MTTWTQAVHSYLTGATPSRLRNQRVEFVDHWQGRDNLLWRVRSREGGCAVVKMFMDAGQARSRRQFNGQELFSDSGLAPEPLWYDRYPIGLPRQILVYRWAEGDPLQVSVPTHRNALAAAAARVHGAGTEAVGRFSPHPFNLLTFWQIWQSEEAPLRGWLARLRAPLLTELLSNLWETVRATVDRELPLMGETPPAPIHGELFPENSLVRDTGTVLLDWEYFGLGDPAQEIARLFFYGADDWPAENRQQWWDWYMAGGADASVPDRVELHLRLLSFRSATFLLEGIRQNMTGGAETAARDRGSGFAMNAAGRGPSAGGDPGAADSIDRYGSFLNEALEAAISRSLDNWELSPLASGDRQLLAKEVTQILNRQLAVSRPAGPTCA